MEITNVDVTLNLLAVSQDIHHTRSHERGAVVEQPSAQANDESPDEQGPQLAGSSPDVSSYKAFFAVDEDQRVVIRIIDSEGNLIQQVPAEEYVRTAQNLQGQMKHLLHIKA